MDERFEQLLAINRAIAESLDYEEVLHLVVDQTSRLLEADACALLLADDDGAANVVAARGVDPRKLRKFRAQLDERIHTALHDLLDLQAGDAFLGVPVVHAGNVSGILAVRRRGRAHRPDDETVLSALGDQAAIALDHAGRYRKLWQESQKARRELETADRRKNEFLAMLSHELRNPLAAIVNAITILRMTAPPEPELVRVQDAAARQAMHMKRLLDDLLDVSRVMQNKILLERAPVSLQDVVQQALQSVEAHIADKRHDLRVTLPESPLVVNGDNVRLVQVVSNLLTNAAKYTDSGGHIAVSLARENGDAVLHVRDDGVGIPLELLPTIFDLFVQARQDVHRGEGGLGVGLSLVRRLVQEHGGTVVPDAAASSPCACR
jgi:signal transduction histidine kinase